MNRKIFLIKIFITVAVIIFFSPKMTKALDVKQSKKTEIRYVPIGDSYTIGTGATEAQSWPALLVEHLRSKGVNITLIENPARAGWSIQEAMILELPVFKSAKPNFATLMIGVNDLVRGQDINIFRKHLQSLMDRMLSELPQHNRLVILTIPDFLMTPQGRAFSNGQDFAGKLQKFNAVIQEEAKARNLVVIDLYPVSKQMGQDPTLIARDGLHPSAKEYAVWENEIFPKVFELLTISENQ